jgi:hypothetical protein
MRYLVRLAVDVEAQNSDKALDQAVATIISAGRIDGFDAEVEPMNADTHAFCKYLGNDAWDCGHLDNAEEQCDCHVCMPY